MPRRFVVLFALAAIVASPCTRFYEKEPYHKNPRSTTPLFRFEKQGRSGFINAQGEIVITPRFDVGWFAEEDFVEGLSPARRGDLWGFIDTDGHWAVEPKFWSVQPFSEELAAVTLRSGFSRAYIDKYGKILIDGLAEAGLFSEGLAAVRIRGNPRVGYIDRTGAVVIPHQFAKGGEFHSGLAAVVFDGQCYIRSQDGLIGGSPPAVPPASSCGGVPDSIVWSCEEGFIDRTGKVVFRFQGVRDFSEGLAAVEKGGKWGFIEPDGRFRVAAKFENARSFSEGAAAVKFGGKWGYIDPGGQWLISPRFETAAPFSDGLALTDQGYFDQDGRLVTRASGATSFVQGLSHVSLGRGEFGYIDHSGRVVFRYRPEAVRPRLMPYSPLGF
jgi:hypothetical protein